jgi:hypothetical protein
MQTLKDRDGRDVHVGSRARVLELSGDWLDQLPAQDKQDVLSMVGEIFAVESIDEYGSPCISKTWPEEDDGYRIHEIALASHEMVVVDGHPD